MRGDMPCRRSFAFWKRWHPSGLHSARMLNAAALPLLVMLCLPLLCGKLGGQPDNPAVAHTDEPASGDAGRD